MEARACPSCRARRRTTRTTRRCARPPSASASRCWSRRRRAAAARACGVVHARGRSGRGHSASARREAAGGVRRRHAVPRAARSSAPRHVEVQVFGDAHGHVVHLFERDCSVQRRHQKVIEESPSPGFHAALRASHARCGRAARAPHRLPERRHHRVPCRGRGDDAPFYFLEMNTRLQVEHPVTEAVAGIDLVRAQLESPSGEPLPWRQESLAQRGHAIECRIYAEDPGDGLPAAGRAAARSTASRRGRASASTRGRRGRRGQRLLRPAAGETGRVGRDARAGPSRGCWPRSAGSRSSGSGPTSRS